MRGVPLRYSIRNLGRRPGRTVLTFLGLTLIVAVVTFLVAFGRSIALSVRLPGDPRALIALSKKAHTFELSSIPASELDRLQGELTEELEEDEFGEPLLSKELFYFVTVRLHEDPEFQPRRGILHGMDPDLTDSMLLGFELVSGRLPEPGRLEIVVGRAVADKLRASPGMLAEGAKVQVRDAAFTVVGSFQAPGTLYENWILCHLEDLRNTLGRRDYSIARLRVRDGVDMRALATRLSLDERYELRVLPEQEYFADFMEGFDHFQQFAVLLALVLGIAGVLTGMNTMHNAVVGRIREIGVLRVLGFSRPSIFLSFLIESLILTAAAGAVACVLGVLTNGLPIRVPIAASFPLMVDVHAVAAGFAASLAIGVLGILFPMLRALRKPTVEAVRAA
jgi:ABC-type antimicrobial peptide transport system permease subunit